MRTPALDEAREFEKPGGFGEAGAAAAGGVGGANNGLMVAAPSHTFREVQRSSSHVRGGV